MDLHCGGVVHECAWGDAEGHNVSEPQVQHPPNGDAVIWWRKAFIDLVAQRSELLGRFVARPSTDRLSALPSGIVLAQRHDANPATVGRTFVNASFTVRGPSGHIHLCSQPLLHS